MMEYDDRLWKMMKEWWKNGERMLKEGWKKDETRMKQGWNKDETRMKQGWKKDERMVKEWWLKMMKDDGKCKKEYIYEYPHFWLNNDKVFNIMRSVAEYDFEIQTNLFKSIQQPLRNKHGFELYIKIGDWCALEDSSFGEDSYLKKAERDA